MVRIIADIGSTHGGSLSNCIDAVSNAADIGLKDVKFQVLEQRHLKSGNIPINIDWLPTIYAHGLEVGVNVFASVWNKNDMLRLSSLGISSIKFAYSARNEHKLINKACELFDEVFVSCDHMSIPAFGCIPLYCIPMYPVPFVVNFEELFPKFAGFSDHTLGIKQSLCAALSGAKIIEKHVVQDFSSNCPDSKFAVTWDQLSTLIKKTKNIT